MPLQRSGFRHAGYARGTKYPAPNSRRNQAGADETMNVLAVTVFVGVVLVVFFVVMFLREFAGPHGANERDALLPLALEKPRTARPKPEPLSHQSTNSI